MTAPSPICTVQDGAGAAQATTNGVDVTPTNTVTIALATTAGADVWTLTCIGTDETSVAATVTSGLTINQTTKTATFTAPAAGKSYLFRSTVRSSGSADSYSATFKVCTLTSDLLRVAALGETVENSASFGWVPIVNQTARGLSSSYRVGPHTLAINDADYTIQFSNANRDDIVNTGGADALVLDFIQTHAELTAWWLVTVANRATSFELAVTNVFDSCVLEIVDSDGSATSKPIIFDALTDDIRAGSIVTIDQNWGYVRMIYLGNRWNVVAHSGCTFS